jgi:hypothetical protein
MTIYNPDGNHEKYTDTDRHFSPSSEIYTGADSLLTAQRNGWELVNIAYEQVVQMRGGRTTSLYYFKLIQNGEKMIMPIVATPFIERMLLQRKMLLLPFPNRATNDIRDQTVEMAAVRVNEG